MSAPVLPLFFLSCVLHSFLTDVILLIWCLTEISEELGCSWNWNWTEKKTSTTKIGQGGRKNESCSPGMIIHAIANCGDLTSLLQQLVLTAVGNCETADVFHPDNFLQPKELRVLVQGPSTLTAKLSPVLATWLRSHKKTSQSLMLSEFHKISTFPLLWAGCEERERCCY